MASTKQNNDFLRDVIPSDLLDQAIEYIQKNLNPEDVFTDNQLQDWAESNDYVKE